MLKPFHNKSKKIKVIDGVQIPPGQVRSIPAHLHPEQPTAAQINPNQVLVDLLALSIPKITAELSDLTLVELKQLGDLEAAAEKPRTSLLETINRECMARAEDPNDQEYQRLKAFSETLQDKTLEELETLRTTEEEGEDRAENLAVIDAKIELLKAGE